MDSVTCHLTLLIVAAIPAVFCFRHDPRPSPRIIACLLALLPDVAEARRTYRHEDRADDCAQYAPIESQRRTITLALAPGQSMGWYEPQAEDGGRLLDSPDVVLVDAGSGEIDAVAEAEPAPAPLQIGADPPVSVLQYAELREIVLIRKTTLAALGMALILLILILKL